LVAIEFHTEIGKMVRSRGASPSLRQLRVGEELRHALVRALSRGRLNDPALAEANITVTEVKVSPDLRNATVFVTPLGGADMQTTVNALNRAAGFLRGELGREITLRYTPRLVFAADLSFDHAKRMQDLMVTARVRRDVTTPGDDDAGAAAGEGPVAGEGGGHDA
jgi:ribosome-binding factor A